jgi:hypothetical protein
MNMNPKFSLIPILLIVALALAACGEAQTATPSPTLPPVAEVEPTAAPTSPPPTLSPTTEPTPTDTPTPEPTATPEPLEALGFFNPQCDRRPFEIEHPSQIHPETGESWTLYANEEYGFSFLFPPEWALIEGNNYLCLNYQPRPEVKLVIGYKWFNDRNVAIIRPGVAAGELTASGEIEFLGQEVERNILRYEDQDKALLYANAAHIRANDLFFTFSLDDFSADYDLADLTPDIMETADAIVESFELIDRLYVNETYGFAFTLPPEWRLQSTAFYNFDLPPSQENGLRLSYRPDITGNTDLTIGFKWEEEEDINIMRTGTGELDELIEGEIEFMGQTIRRDVWRYEDKTTAVFYQGASHINVNGLLFTLSLDYHDPTYTGRTLIPEAMSSADAIVQSFHLLAERQLYRSEEFGFQFTIPDGYLVQEYEHPDALLLLSLYEEGAEVDNGRSQPEIFVTVQQNQENLRVGEWFLAHSGDTLTDDYPLYVNPRHPQTHTVGGRPALSFEDMTWSHARVTLIEGDGYILAAGYVPYDNPALAQAFQRLLASLLFPR